jgi:pimeloyl-ACP methyl ester carboxylesterase
LLILGHSYGGLVARAAALAGAPITGLTLLGSGPGELPNGERRRALDDGEVLLRTEGIAAAQRLREKRDATNPWWAQLPEELRTLLRTRFLSSSAAGLLGMADGLRYEPDLVVQLRKALRSARAGCLVICGEHDNAWPVAMQRDMADRLDADFAVVPRSAHSPNTENPDALLATLLPTWRAWLN